MSKIKTALSDWGNKINKNNYWMQLHHDSSFSVEAYFASKNDTVPFTFFYDGSGVICDDFEELLLKFNPETKKVFEKRYFSNSDNYSCTSSGNPSAIMTQVVYELMPDFIIDIYYIFKLNYGNSDKTTVTAITNACLHKNIKVNKESIFFSRCNIFYNPKHVEVIKSFEEFISKNSFNYVQDSPQLGIISFSDGDYFIKYIDITSKIDDFKEPDLHYGNGFDDFQIKLKEKISNETKGLILFHGDPGTGKTFFLRHLIKELGNKKNFLYMSSSMIENITDPRFLTFLTEEILNMTNKDFVIIIEDAETLLVERRDSRFINGMSNILNLSDGLLNDILSIQIIATFNTDISNIDNALLRQGRLIARKKFEPLKKEQAIELLEYLNIKDIEVKDSMTLADIYVHKKATQFIEHNINIEKPIVNKIGFIM